MMKKLIAILILTLLPMTSMANRESNSLEVFLLSNSKFLSDSSVATDVQFVLDRNDLPLKDFTETINANERTAAQTLADEAAIHNVNYRVLLVLLEMERQGFINLHILSEIHDDNYPGFADHVHTLSVNLATEFELASPSLMPTFPDILTVSHNAASYAILAYLKMHYEQTGVLFGEGEMANVSRNFVNTYSLLFTDNPRDELMFENVEATPFMYKPYRIEPSLNARLDHDSIWTENSQMSGTYFDSTQYTSISYAQILCNPGGTLKNYKKTANGTCMSYDSHSGYDYGLANGTYVYPVATGTYHHRSDGSAIYGEVIHNGIGTGYVTWYIHITQHLFCDGCTITDINVPIATVGSGHLHLTVRKNGKFTDPYGWWAPEPDPLGNLSNGVASEWLWLELPPNQAPHLPEHNSPANNSWTKSTLLQWTEGDDDGQPNSYPDFWIQVDNNSDFSSPEVSTGWGYLLTYLVANLPVDQNYYWRVNQGDGALPSGWTTPWLFKLDRALPFVNCNLSGPGSGNGWYTGTVNVVCSAHDNTGTNNSGPASVVYELDDVPQPATFQVTNQGAHRVDYKATDNATNETSGSKSAGIDWTPSVITSMAINNGASVTHSANVVVNFTYSETLSGPWEMCASLNQASWTCETFATAMAFSLPNLNQTTHTVFFRLEDRAGNLSTVVSDSIYLDLYSAMPSSTSYQLCQGTVAAAAGTSSSASYQLVTNLGVPGDTSTSTSYQLTTGISQGCIAPGGNTYLPLTVRSIN